MAFTTVIGTYARVLEVRDYHIAVRDNAVATDGLAKIFNAQLDGKDFNRAIKETAEKSGISVNQLEHYYDWYYGCDPARTAYLYIREDGQGNPIEYRYDGVGLPSGVRVIGLFDEHGGYLTGYIPDSLKGEPLLYAIQMMLDTLRILDTTAEEVVLSRYTEFGS